jgi:UPF0755 protein
VSDAAPPVIGRDGRRGGRDGGRDGRRGGEPSQPPPPRRRRGRGLLVALLLLAAAAASAAGYVRWGLDPAGTSTEAVTFEVPRGIGARGVVTRLHEAGLIREPRVFLALLVWQGNDRRIGEGLYDLAPAMDAHEVAAALVRGGRPRTLRLVVPEGSRLVDVAARLESVGLAPRETALAAATSVGGARPFLPAAATLEGYLFPAVYEVPIDEVPERTLARMLARFERELDETTLARVEAEGFTVHEWVTLASMIQAEAGGEEEMAIIAGVFRNRLDIGMRLQSDPTVAYGLGKDLPALDFPRGDFDVDHPWNTYTRAGLPAGPIGSPGRAALEAALAPERRAPNGRPWLYFLHGRDGGEIVFRPNVDLDGHLRDVRRFLR